MDEPDIEVRDLSPDDAPVAVEVINAAARWYREFLDEAEYHDPEMTADQWLAEAERMTWSGAFEAGELVGVMGLEYSGDAALFRHAYVLPGRQRQGIAGLLHQYLEAKVDGVELIVVGTYAANYKARNALEKAGYELSPDAEAVLRRYYDIPEDRLRSSVTYERRLGEGRVPGS